MRILTLLELENLGDIINVKEGTLRFEKYEMKVRIKNG